MQKRKRRLLLKLPGASENRSGDTLARESHLRRPEEVGAERGPWRGPVQLLKAA